MRNVAPSVAPTNDGPIDEGSAVTVQANGSDPGVTDVLEYVFDCDGDGFLSLWQASAEATCGFAQDGSHAVGMAARDDDGGVGTTAATMVTVRNVAPSVSLASPAPARWGMLITFTATATDPSPIDQAALTYAWDLDGDGTYELTGAGASVSHSFERVALNPVRVQVCDDDTCTGTSTQHQSLHHRTTLRAAPALIALWGLKLHLGQTSAYLLDEDTGLPVPGATVAFGVSGRSAPYCTACDRCRRAGDVRLPAGTPRGPAGVAALHRDLRRGRPVHGFLGVSRPDRLVAADTMVTRTAGGSVARRRSRARSTSPRW